MTRLNQNHKNDENIYVGLPKHENVFEHDEKTSSKKPSKYNLDIGDCYYYLSSENHILKDEFSQSDDDIARFDNGNAYTTLESCCDELAKRKTVKMLKNFAGGYEFTPYEDNWYLLCSQDDKKNIRVKSENENYQPGIIYFKSEEDAEKAIIEIGRDYLFDTYFKI